LVNVHLILSYSHGNNVVVALPEKFIGEGASNGNFLILDAQDLGGVDKTHLRNVSLLVIGKMMEATRLRGS